MSFGRMPMANGFLEKKEFKKEFFYNLKVGFNKNNYLFQVDNHPKSTQIFNDKYPFFTKKSKYMIKHFKNFFIWLKKNYLKKGNKIIEIGSNDGTFSSYFLKSKFNILGFEPSLNVAKIAKKKKLKVISKFFNYKNVSKLRSYKKNTDLICAANVICHIPNLKDLIKCIDFLLSENGVFIFEEPYLGSMFKKISYDQIYDEHVYIFSAISASNIFGAHGFELIDLKPQETHGGSMRYVFAKKGQREIQPIVKQIIDDEYAKKFNHVDTYNTFKQNCEDSKLRLKNILEDAKKLGKSVAGYGATSKSTTILNYCDIGPNLISFISDTTPIKQNKVTPGMHIPVKSYEFFKENVPDVIILFAWNHAKEIIEKERGIIDKEVQWITHLPDFDLGI